MPLHSTAARAIGLLLLGTALMSACSGDDSATPDRPTTTESTDPTAGGESEATGETEALAPSTTEGAAGTDAPLARYALGPLALNQTLDDATATGLIGPWQDGCEFDGAPEQVAELQAPLVGTVHAFDDAIFTIAVTGGPTATDPGGVTVGTQRDDAVQSFADAGLTMEVHETPESQWSWTVIDDEGSVFGGTIDAATGEITSLATPFAPSCG